MCSYILYLVCEYRKRSIRIVWSHHKDIAVFMSVLSISLYDAYKNLITSKANLFASPPILSKIRSRQMFSIVSSIWFLRALLVLEFMTYIYFFWSYLIYVQVILFLIIEYSKPMVGFTFFAFHICCLYSPCIVLGLVWARVVYYLPPQGFMGLVHHYNIWYCVDKLSSSLWVLRGYWGVSLLKIICKCVHTWDLCVCQLWCFSRNFSYSMVI